MGAGYRIRACYRVARSWGGRPACTSPGPLERWDIDHGSPRQLAEGMAQCRDCPIVGQCLAEAVQRKETGVFGGRVVVEGRITPLARWLARRADPTPRIAPVVVDRRVCLNCGEEFDVIAPRFGLKRCDPCRGPRQLARSRRRRAEVSARALGASQASA